MKVGRDNQDRAKILELSDRLIPDLATPPRSGLGVCGNCATWIRANDLAGNDRVGRRADPTARDGGTDNSGPTSVVCENCIEVREALDREPLALSVVSLYRKPSPLRDALTRYKGRNDEDDPFDPRCAEVVRAMLGRYLLDHGDSLAELTGGVDGVVVVPSTDRTPPHPLKDLFDSLELELPSWPLLTRGTGDLGFRKPDRDGYQVVMDLEPKRILLIDDVYTTGSRLNSAASALARNGHETVAALVLARRINTDYASEAGELWASATAEPFEWQTSPRSVRS